LWGQLALLEPTPADQRIFLLKGIIRPAIEEGLNLKIWRADEDHQPGMITDKVISDIYGSNLVIADLSELNPNVFYELGIRHSASLPTIHMASSATKLPFDNLGHRVIFFDRSDWDNIEDAKTQLLSQASVALGEGFEVSNPVTQALSARAFHASAKPTERMLAELMGRMERLESTESAGQYSHLTRNKIQFDEGPREVRDIFEDVAAKRRIEVEEPYFTQAIYEILKVHGRSSISRLYDNGDTNSLVKIFQENYIPF
jgi:hypothetical protein